MGIRKIKVSEMILLTGLILTLGTSTVLAQNVAYAPPDNDGKKVLSTSQGSAKTANPNSSSINTDKSVNGNTSNSKKTVATPVTIPQANEKVPDIAISKKGNTTTVSDGAGWLATFTDGARTVSMRGKQRTFREPGVSATVTNNVWVRILNSPFRGTVDKSWLSEMQNNVSNDVLGIAMQYVYGSPTLRDATGKIYASDADYGPLNPDGTRQEGSDFNDYIGIDYAYDGVTDSYEVAQSGAMDCSGFMRMVWGYRSGIAMTNQDQAQNSKLPRRAVQMYATGPGIVIISKGSNAQSFTSSLMPGDLVFFDASSDDGTAIDHVGLYLGTDSTGNQRFVSSRKTANGPTIGDNGGKSVLNGTGFYAKSFVAARRL